ncbi:MAG: nuclear transport factor 2 family protein, partial [Longicatena sp.]
MIKKKIEACIQLTETILTEHFCQGVVQDTLRKHIDENCLWIGSIAKEYVRGKDEILRSLSKEAGKLPIFVLTSKEFECVEHDRKMAVISGRYIGCTVEGSDEIYRDMQRVTFVWKEKDGRLVLTHFHVSNPMINVEKDEGFPHAIGVFTKEYMDSMLHDDKNKYLNVKDEHNTYQRMLLTEIIYIEAFDKHCIVHLKDRDILAKASISDVEEQVTTTGCKFILRVQK